MDNEQTTSINLSSMKVSELPALSSLSDNSFIVLERGDSSYKIQYSAFRQSVFNYINQHMEIGSIAHRDKNEYAKFAHGHDYTDFWFFPSYGPQSSNKYYDLTGALVDYTNEASCQTYGRFDIVKYLPGQDEHQVSSISVCAPIIYQNVDYDKMVDYDASWYKWSHNAGDVQPLAIACSLRTYLEQYRGYTLVDVGGITNVDIRLSSFDGWVVPNGATYSCAANEFKQACKLFGPNHLESDTYFTVPDLATFIRGDFSSTMRRISSHMALPKHDHSREDGAQINDAYIDSALNIDSIQFYLYSSNHGGNVAKQFAHGGKTTQSNYGSSVDIKKIHVHGDIYSFTVSSTGEDKDVWPTHTNVPVLLYIGGR